MAENNKRVVVVGIPGVGKTTVISRTAEILNQRGIQTAVVVFGTMMFEEAGKLGINNRDEMRRQSIEVQRHMQNLAARRIADLKDNIVIVDTHLFINTNEGYYPGLPLHLLEVIKPTNIVMVAADPEEIVNRRRIDETRDRDIESVENIQYQLDLSKVMVATCSVLTGCPFIIIMNSNNKIDETASNIVKALSDDNGSRI
ncbi:MAG TPA: adenylate kinase [Nitrososphaeraceae archaeon]|nr:adenylate kinase [Thermoproteota archaeon]HZA64938.1 adenylate kinase [Nitrososphaeraceae archaeon]